MDHNDPAILSYGGFSQRLVASQETVASSQDVSISKKERTDSPNLSISEPDVRNILRYSRKTLLYLRESELSKRKPEQLGRAWVRIGVSHEGKLDFLSILLLSIVFTKVMDFKMAISWHHFSNCFFFFDRTRNSWWQRR